MVLKGIVVALQSLNTYPNSKGKLQHTESGMAACGVTLYGPPVSSAVSRVMACLFEKDVEFHLENIDMSKAQHKSPDFLKLQPFGQVPAFEDYGFTIFESRAICRYICTKYANKGNQSLLGNDILERASVDQWLEAESQSYSPPSSVLLWQLVLAPMMGKPTDKGLIELNKTKFEKVLDVYDKRLNESRFLCGDDFTLADLSHLPNSENIVHRTEVGQLITSRKNVGRWWEEISNRPSWKKVNELQKQIKSEPW